MRDCSPRRYLCSLLGEGGVGSGEGAAAARSVPEGFTGVKDPDKPALSLSGTL